MARNLYSFAADGISVALDLDLGQIARLEIRRDGRAICPFHSVPWMEEPQESFPETAAPHLRRMSIDFFCAPFSRADVEAAPLHGWPANSGWHLLADEAIAGGRRVRFELDRRVMGARLVKELVLRDNHPFLYQLHRFEGGTGRISVAHHTMFAFPGGAEIAMSPKSRIFSPETALEPDPARGRSVLAYPAESREGLRFPMKDGGMADLSRYPIAQRHEDLLQMIDAPGVPLGWVAAARAEERDLGLILKDPRQLPSTVLWYSNGGRDYAPWNGRHRHVLGVEEAATTLQGHRASAQENALSRDGVATSVDLDDDPEIRLVIGACPYPGGPGGVASLTPGEEVLEITLSSGLKMQLPFDGAFLGQNLIEA